MMMSLKAGGIVRDIGGIMLDPDFQTIGVGFDVSGYPYTWTQFFTGATGNIGVSKMQLVKIRLIHIRLVQILSNRVFVFMSSMKMVLRALFRF